MTSEDEITFRDDFAKWYKTLEIEEDLEKVESRWKGVLTAKTSIVVEDLDALLRIVLRGNQANVAATKQKLIDAFRSVDEYFPLSDNTREIEILTGAIISLILAENTYLSSKLTLAVLSAFLYGNRKPEIPIDITARAANTLRKLSSLDRTRPTFDKLKLSNRKVDLSKATAEVAKGVDGFPQAAMQITAVVNAVVKDINSAIEGLRNFIEIQDEELEILWWLTARQSTTLAKPFDEMNADEKVIFLPIEVAKMVQEIPGPESAGSLLRRAGIDDSKVKVVDVINSANLEDLQKREISGNLSAVMTPLTFGIARRLETGDKASWIAGWAAATSLNESVELSRSEIALQFYREYLVIER